MPPNILLAMSEIMAEEEKSIQTKPKGILLKEEQNNSISNNNYRISHHHHRHHHHHD